MYIDAYLYLLIMIISLPTIATSFDNLEAQGLYTCKALIDSCMNK
jgi:hypothetical protein